MLESLVHWSIRHRLAVIAISVALACVGAWTLPRQHIDALPDVSSPSIIVYAQWDQTADLVEAQVTYPLTSALLGTPNVRSVRGQTDGGYSIITVLVGDGADVNVTRARVDEALSNLRSSLPYDARVAMGPDATAVGWVFQYALVDTTGRFSTAALRQLQDTTVRYALRAVPGVAEVASVGGAEPELQVTVDPLLLEDRGISLRNVIDAVRRANGETSARVLDLSGTQYTVRARGSVHSIDDLQRAVVYADHGAKSEMNMSRTAFTLADVARVELASRDRQSVTDLDGHGESPGGLVIMRQGENALAVTNAAKHELDRIQQSLPQGVRIVTTYDRSDLISRCIEVLKSEVIAGIVIVSLTILLFLWHFPSAVVAIVTIPVTLLIAAIPLYWMRVNLNIMSLAGVVLSTGVLVDGVIIQVENVYRRLALAGVSRARISHERVSTAAIVEVAPAVFFSLLAIAIAFLPVFALTGQEQRLFLPLAITKTVVIILAAIVSVVFAPAFRSCFVSTLAFDVGQAISPVTVGVRSPALSDRASRVINALLARSPVPESRSAVWGWLYSIYDGVLTVVLRKPAAVFIAVGIAALVTIPVFMSLGDEFMPPLNEGTILYMPTTLPGISADEIGRVLQRQDRILASFPEVERVFGKAGRADTPTDPAPLSMIESTIVLKPENEWREKRRWYSSWVPDWMKQHIFRALAPDRISYDELIAEMDRQTKLLGLVNSWTMPIRGRTSMLATGARTPIAVDVLGANVHRAQQIALQIEATLKEVPGTRSVFAERPTEGYFIDIQPDRTSLVDYGLQLGDVHDVIDAAIGGAEATQILDGLNRSPVTVRYPKNLRDNPDVIGQITVRSESGELVPLSSLASIRQVRDTGMIRSENGRNLAQVFVDTNTSDIAGYVESAKQAINKSVSLPAGYSLNWTGDYENVLHTRERMRLLLPVTLFILLGILYVNTRSWTKTAFIMLAVPLSLIGAVWMLAMLGYSMSIATWVGIIALMGLDAETGVFMLLYLDLAYSEAERSGRLCEVESLRRAVISGAAGRLRPKLMTVVAAMAGLLPALAATGMGSEVVKRIAAPMAGGLAVSFFLELLIYPPLYFLWKQRAVRAPHHVKAVLVEGAE